MKMVTINKIKVRVFEEDDLIQKLGFSDKESELILKYQRAFPELLQDNEFKLSSVKKLYKELEFNTSHYSRWVKRNIENSKNFFETSDWEVLAHWATTEKGGTTAKDYSISVEFAKHLCMQGEGEKCFMIRRYFTLMEKALRNFESWSVTRGVEKEGWKTMKKQIKQWCERKGFDDIDYMYIREANLLNESLTGFKASQLRSYVGAKDDITRDSLEQKVNKALDELQTLNTSLLMSDLDFDFRKQIIKTTCENKYSDLYINNIKEVS